MDCLPDRKMVLVDIRNMADGWIDSFVVRYRSRRSIDSFAYGMKGTQLDI